MRKSWIMWIIGMCIFAVFEKSEFVLTSNIRMIPLVLLPGPEATHICVRLLHVECSNSQGRPVSIQCGPLVLGETSPRLAEANAATKDPLPIGLFASYSLLSSISFSSIRLAKPLLSPEIS